MLEFVFTTPHWRLQTLIQFFFFFLPQDANSVRAERTERHANGSTHTVAVISTKTQTGNKHAKTFHKCKFVNSALKKSPGDIQVKLLQLFFLPASYSHVKLIEETETPRWAVASDVN